MTATLYDVARRAHVSVATVSRALHGKYPVARETRDRIREAVQELNYEPSELTRRFLDNKGSPIRYTGNIGIALGDIFKKFSDPFWSGIFDGVNEEVRRQQYRIRFTFTPDELAQEESRRLISHTHIDGLLCIGKQSIPGGLAIEPAYIVTIEHDWTSPLLIDNIVPEKRRAMHAMVEHLLSLGHRSFHFITGNLVDERTAAFAEAMLSHHIPLVPELHTQTGWSTEEAFASVQSLLSGSKTRPDVLVCASDLIAIGAMRAVNALGLRVPGDIAVTGFDDIPFARDLDPSLTTIHVPNEQMGQFAVRKLIERIHQPELPPIIQVVPTSLVIRRSCGASR